MSWRIGLVGSSGGHLAQLWWLESWWRAHDRFWVTFDTEDARELLADERWFSAAHPTTRNVPNMLRNTRLAWRVLRRERPDVLVSTGAGVALPFFAVAKSMGIPVVFVEVYDRVDMPSLTGRLVGPWADRVILQWPAQQHAYPHGIVLGPIR